MSISNFFSRLLLFYLSTLALVVGVPAFGCFCFLCFGVRRLGDLAFSGVGGCFLAFGVGYLGIYRRSVLGCIYRRSGWVLAFGVWRSGVLDFLLVSGTTLTFTDHTSEVLLAVLWHGNMHPNLLFSRALFPVTWYYTASWWRKHSLFSLHISVPEGCEEDCTLLKSW
ncbi:hypothetical protein F4679DRAFT_569165 [Xylaria curta]|nr:hypothetical protein F4679DRAFT_569165 [Xylaria curta]